MTDDVDPHAWIEASPYYVRCIDPDCPVLGGADPPLRHYHYVGEPKWLREVEPDRWNITDRD